MLIAQLFYTDFGFIVTGGVRANARNDVSRSIQNGLMTLTQIDLHGMNEADQCA